MKSTVASLAFLASCWKSEEGYQDYIDLFLPFLARLINLKEYQIINVYKLVEDFSEVYGLKIPLQPMQTILRRAKTRGYVKKDQIGNWHPVKEKLQDLNFQDITGDLEEGYQTVIRQFVVFCKEKGEGVTEEEADTIIISFLKGHDLDILLINDDVQTILPEAESTKSESYLFNSFIIDCWANRKDIFEFIKKISIGHIIASSLVREEADKFKGKIHLNYYLDTNILFFITGINGDESQSAYQDLVRLLNSNSSGVFVFRHIYYEYLGILESCAEMIDRPYVDIAKANRALRYFLEKGFNKAQVHQFITSVEFQLREQGIQVVDIPNPNDDTQYQIDERDLKEKIIETYKRSDPDFDESDKDFTLQNDIKSIAAIYKLRKGFSPTSFREVRHVLITTNVSLVFANREFEKSLFHQEFFFIPMVLTDMFIGTLLWIEHPTEDIDFEPRLIANAYAAIQPSKQTIQLMVESVQKMKKDKVISETEAIAFTVSSVARHMMNDEILGDPDRFTPVSVMDVLDDFRRSIHQDEAEKFQVEKQKLVAKEEHLLQENAEKEEIIRLREIELSQQSEDLEAEKLSREVILCHAKKRSQMSAKIISVVFSVISFLILLFTLIMPYFRNTDQFPSWLRIILIVIGVFTNAVTTYFGWNIRGFGGGVQVWIRNKIFKDMTSQDYPE